MNLKSDVSKFLTNKWVLNIVALLALFNVIGYAVIGNFNNVIYFIVIAILVRYFSKNMTIILGDRFQGPLGSIVALSGLMIMPTIILLALTTIYDAFAANPDVRAATVGAGAAAAGLIIGLGLKMGMNLKLRPIHLAFAVATFICMAVLRLPFIGVVLVLTPLCIAATFWSRRNVR